MRRELFEVQEKILTLLQKAAKAGFANDHAGVIECQWKILVLSLGFSPFKDPAMPSTVRCNGQDYSAQSHDNHRTVYTKTFNPESYAWAYDDLVARRAIELYGRRRGEEVVKYGLSYVMRG
jgi:hypothetical protein